MFNLNTYVIILIYKSNFCLLYYKFFITIKTYYSGKESLMKFITVPKVNEIKNNPVKNMKYALTHPDTVFGTKSP